MPTGDVVNPLTEEHLTQINTALNNLDMAQKAIDQAKRAGLDFSDKEKQVQQHAAQLRQIKQVYFPGR